MWQALRAAGIRIDASWIDAEFNATGEEPHADQWARHSERCLREAANSDICLLYCESGEQHFGSLLECGSALGNGKRVYAVTPHAWPFLRHHPRVRNFASLAGAIEAIKSSVLKIFASLFALLR